MNVESNPIRDLHTERGHLMFYSFLLYVPIFGSVSSSCIVYMPFGYNPRICIQFGLSRDNCRSFSSVYALLLWFYCPKI